MLVWYYCFPLSKERNRWEHPFLLSFLLSITLLPINAIPAHLSLRFCDNLGSLLNVLMKLAFRTWLALHKMQIFLTDSVAPSISIFCVAYASSNVWLKRMVIYATNNYNRRSESCRYTVAIAPKSTETSIACESINLQWLQRVPERCSGDEYEKVAESLLRRSTRSPADPASKRKSFKGKGISRRSSKPRRYSWTKSCSLIEFVIFFTA